MRAIVGKKKMQSDIITGFTEEAYQQLSHQIDVANVRGRNSVNFNIRGIVPEDMETDVIIFLKSRLKKLGYTLQNRGNILVVSWR